MQADTSPSDGDARNTLEEPNQDQKALYSNFWDNLLSRIQQEALSGQETQAWQMLFLHLSNTFLIKVVEEGEDWIFWVGVGSEKQLIWLRSFGPPSLDPFLSSLVGQKARTRFIPVEEILETTTVPQNSDHSNNNGDRAPAITPEPREKTSEDDESQKASRMWAAALGQLQMEMPKAAFNTWVRDAVLVSFDNGRFVIGVNNAYARDWLKSRLDSTIIRLLTGMMNRTITVDYMVVSPDNLALTDESNDLTDRTESLVEEDGDGSEEDLLRIISEELDVALREVFVDLNQIVNTPAYLLRHLPFDGPDVISLVIGIRQERYLKTMRGAHRKSTGSDDRRWDGSFSTTIHEILRWTGISRSTYFNILKTREFGKHIRQPQPFRFQLTCYVPLTPVDAFALFKYLLDTGVRENPIDVLKECVENLDPGDVWQLYPPPGPEEMTDEMAELFPLNEVHTVRSVVDRAVGNIYHDKELLRRVNSLSEELEARLLADNIQNNWYFFLKHMPELKARIGMMVLYVRSLGFYNRKKRIIPESVTLENASPVLAKVLKLSSTKSFDRWFPKSSNRGRKRLEYELAAEATQDDHDYEAGKQDLVARFIQRTGITGVPGNTCDWQLKVAYLDPLTDGDQLLYDELHQAISSLASACYGDEDVCEETKAILGETIQWLTETQTTVGRKNDKSGLRLKNKNDNSGRAQVVQKDNFGPPSGWQKDNFGPLNDILGLANFGQNDNSEPPAWNLNDKNGHLKVLRVLNICLNLISKISSLQTTRAEARSFIPSRWEVGGDLPSKFPFENLIKKITKKDVREDLAEIGEKGVFSLLSWLFYAASPVQGKGLNAHLIFAGNKVIDNPEEGAGGSCDRLAQLSPSAISRLMVCSLNIEGLISVDGREDWKILYEKAPPEVIIQLADWLDIPLRKTR